MTADADTTYERITREVAAASCSKGRNIIAGNKWVSGRVDQGPVFSTGSAAEGVIDVGQLSGVYRAIECYKKRGKDGMLVEAAKKAREYLKRASCRQLEADWAIEACRVILETF